MKNTTSIKNTAVTASAASALTASIIEGVKNIRSTKEWAEMLKFQTGFWEYSWHNQLLIWLQTNGTARKVAGFQTWKKKGTCVKKGEKAIKILAPIITKKKDEKTGEEKPVLVGFKVVNVFDIAQTTQGTLPSVWHRSEKEDEKAVGLVDKIKKLSYVHELSASAHEEGSYSPMSGRINIKFSDKANALVETFVHEYCHKMIHEDLKAEEGLKNLDHAMEEIVVESASYILCTLAGIDVETSAFSYVACWLNNGDKDDKEVENALKEITKVANTAAKSLEEQGINLLPAMAPAEAE